MGNKLSSGVDIMIHQCSKFMGNSNTAPAGSGAKHPGRITVGGTEYLIHNCIGEGGYAYVYVASDPHKRKFALKRFAIQEPEQEEIVLEEVKIHKKLCPHDHIVKYIDHDVIHRPATPLPEVWVVMELCGGSVEAEVNRRIQSKQSFTEAEINNYLSDLVAAISHMHSHNPPVSHWDLKIENMLLQDGKMKICDFGSCTTKEYAPRNGQEIATADVEIEGRMTVLYRPPESVDLWGKQAVGLKADTWALGVILYVLLYQQMPFTDNKNEIESAKPADPPNELVGKYPKLEEMLSMLLVKNPNERADIFDISEKLSEHFAIHAMKRVTRPPGLVPVQPQRFE